MSKKIIFGLLLCGGLSFLSGILVAYQKPPVKNTYYVVYAGNNGIVGSFTFHVGGTVTNVADINTLRNRICQRESLDTNAVVITNIIRLPI